MKKTLLLLFMISMTVFLVSCDKKDSGNNLTKPVTINETNPVIYPDETDSDPVVDEDGIIPFSLHKTPDVVLDKNDYEYSHSSDSTLYHCEFLVVSSFSEYVNYIDSFRSYYYDFDNYRDYWLSVYDETYFELNSLVIWSAALGSGSIRIWVENIKVIENTLVLKINELDPTFGTCDIKFVRFQLEVAKADIKDVQETKYVVDYYIYKPASILFTIKEEYRMDYLNYNFTVEDFKFWNIESVITHHWNALGMIGVSINLKECGTAYALEAVEYLKTLHYVNAMSVCYE